MIHLVVALRSEARPLIRRFSLERVGEGRPAVWRGGEISLVVSGMGRARASAAVDRVAAGSPTPSAWVNLGIGGHRSLPLGQTVLAREVIDASSGSVRRLRPLADPPCALATVTTVDRPELDYPDDAVYDMEAAVFCAAVAGSVAPERIQVAKVISDNAAAPPQRLTAERVEELIEGRIDTLSWIVERLAVLAAAGPVRPPATE